MENRKENHNDSAEKLVHNRPLHRIFTAIPRHYDLINHLITWGLDRRWRFKTARECLTSQPEKVLDLCCGTGDLAINIARLSENNVEVIGLDYSQPMLDIANRKAEPLAMRRKLSFTHGDAANLPFPDGYFDCVGISFAFRNLTYKNPLAQCHLAEVLRVLSDGGRYIIVETSQPKSKLIRKLYHLYLRHFVLRLGYLLSGNREAYHYLAESAARFYTSDEIQELLSATGFRKIFSHPLFLGVASIYIATK
ncbi:ubiquinone/menaquinone biosynthesis methyltransferase [Chloroflexota bacterium]